MTMGDVQDRLLGPGDPGACQAMVSGGLASYPCRLPKGHEDEPCVAPESSSSMFRHEAWLRKQRQAEREARRAEPKAQSAPESGLPPLADRPVRRLVDRPVGGRTSDYEPPVTWATNPDWVTQESHAYDADLWAATFKGEIRSLCGSERHRRDLARTSRKTDRCGICMNTATLLFPPEGADE